MHKSQLNPSQKEQKGAKKLKEANLNQLKSLPRRSPRKKSHLLQHHNLNLNLRLRLKTNNKGLAKTMMT